MTYWFKPNGRWNVTTKEAYEVLLRAGYGPEYLKEEESK